MISRRALSFSLSVGVLGCLDLAHTNPFDPATKVTIRVDGPDSTYSRQQIVQFTFTSDPQWGGVIQWRTSNDNLLHPLGDGRYGVVNIAAPPNDTVSALVVLGTHIAAHRVVVSQRIVGFRFSCPCTLNAGTSVNISFDGYDANGFGTVLPFAVNVESSQPSILRIDRSLASAPGSFIYAVTALRSGASYFTVSGAGKRDSALVTVR